MFQMGPCLVLLEGSFQFHMTWVACFLKMLLFHILCQLPLSLMPLQMHLLNNSGRCWIYVPKNPRGAESLPPGIVVSESDFYLRRLWGDPNEEYWQISVESKALLYIFHEILWNWRVFSTICWYFQDLKKKPNYLVTFTVDFN
ncbi:hypothetical protein ACS0TY_033353 [Phlomoides rotata]